MKRRYWFGLAIVLLLVLAVTWQFLGARSMNDPKFLATIVSDEIHYDDDGSVDFVAMLNTRMSRNVLPAENAFIDYARIFGPINRPEAEQAELCKWLKIDSIPNDNPFVSWQEIAVGSALQDGEQNPWEQITRRPWTNEEFPDFARWLEVNARHVDAIHTAARKPKYVYPFVSTLEADDPGGKAMSCCLEYAQRMRDLARFMGAHAMNAVSRGDTNAAIADLESIHRMAAHVSQGLCLVEKLVGIALDGIAFHAASRVLGNEKITPEGLANYRQFLQANRLDLKLAESIDAAERYMLLDVVQLVEKKGMGGLASAIGDDSSTSRTVGRLTWSAVDWSIAARDVSKNIDAIVEQLKQPDDLIRLRELEALETTLKPPFDDAFGAARLIFAGPKTKGKAVGQILSSLFLPSGHTVAAVEIRCRMQREMLDLALAIAEFRLENGRLPEKLEMLVPKHIAKVPLDRFTQQPLIYRVYDDGFELISAGKVGVLNDEAPNKDVRFVARPYKPDPLPRTTPNIEKPVK